LEESGETRATSRIELRSRSRLRFPKGSTEKKGNDMEEETDRRTRKGAGERRNERKAANCRRCELKKPPPPPLPPPQGKSVSPVVVRRAFPKEERAPIDRFPGESAQ